MFRIKSYKFQNEEIYRKYVKLMYENLADSL